MKKRKNKRKRTSYKIRVNKFPNHPIYSHPLFRSKRYHVIRRDNFKCVACNTMNIRLHVDHIKPVSTHPELAFDVSNMQTLCSDCNLSKSNKFSDDIRRIKNSY